MLDASPPPKLSAMDLAVWRACLSKLTPQPPNRHLDDPVGWVRDRLGEHLWSRQREIAESVRDNRYTAVQSCHDAGKGLPLDTKLPTPTGWTTMGEVQPGDALLDEQGLPCKVEAISPIWNEPCFKVRFSNGEEIITDAGHLWSTVRLDERHAFRERRRQKGLPAPTDWREHWALAKTLSTPEIARTLMTGLGQLRHAVPVCAPLDLPEVDLPIEPYVLGAWLGDGTSISPEICCAAEDREIVDRMAALGENMRKRTSCKFGWSMAGPVTGRPILRERLRELGVLGNKHIPMAYLRASREQRIELLRGLMDTDGFNSRNSVGVDFMSERLATDLAELVRSLGCVVNIRPGRATLSGRDVGVRYRLAWRSPFVPFHLERKRLAWESSNFSRRTIRTIASVEPVPSVPTRCIEVSSPSRLYLATEHFIPTHNSFVASRIVAWWLDVHTPGEAFAVTTAPTAAQVSAILWREIRRAHAKGKLNGYITSGAVPEWKLPGGEPIGYGRKPADEDQAAFQGIHALYPLIVVDEAGGVPKTLFDAVDALATNENARVLAIGNPDSSTTHFAEICKPGSGWNVIRIDGLQTPNFTAEAIAEHQVLANLFEQLGLSPVDEVVPDGLRPLLLSPLWVAERILRWGIESPIFTAKVRGSFPQIGEDVLIDPALILAAQRRSLEPGPWAILGVDVARFGSDRTVFCLRRGPVARIVGDYVKQATTETTGRVVVAKDEHDVNEIRVDGVGVGGGVVDQLVEQGHDVVDMQAGAAPIDGEHFLNARSEWMWGLRTRFEAGDIDIDPDDDQLAAQLGSIKYKYTSRGQVQIESKDDMRKRKLPSPDRADALMLTSAASPPPEEVVEDEEDDDFAISSV